MMEALFLSNLWVFKSTLFLGLIITCCFLLGKKVSASVRHLIWMIGFVGMLLTPFIAYLSGQLDSVIRVPVEMAISKPDTEPLSSLSPNIEPSSGKVLPQIEQSASTAVKPLTREALFAWLPVIWLIGMLLCLSLLVVETCLLYLLRWKCSAPNEESLRLFKEIRHEQGFTRSVAVLVSDHIAIPCTAGWLRPTIFLPADFAAHNIQQQRFILLHELAHIRRWDGLSTLITQVACALFWFNPLTWLAARWSKIDMEKACDDLVIASTRQKYDYASLMLDILENSGKRLPSFGGRLAMADKNELKTRMLGHSGQRGKAFAHW